MRKSEKSRSGRKGKSEKSKSKRKGKSEKNWTESDKASTGEKQSRAIKSQTDANLQKEKLEAKLRLRETETKKRDANLETDKFRHKVEQLKAQNHSTVPKRTSGRLSKIELKKFAGQIVKWQEFWDTFEATIHKNSSLQPIEKFNYLRAQLENEALQSIEGLELTNTNYEVATILLKERYGNNQLIVDAHDTKLIVMPPASNKTTLLCAMYDAIEQHLWLRHSLG